MYRVKNSFEHSSGNLEKIGLIKDAPPWLKSQDKMTLFIQHIKERHLNHAWLTLNSTGWNHADAKAAINTLDKEAKDKNFSKLVNACCSQPHDLRATY